METFTQLKALSKNPDYQLQRKKQLDGFNADGLDRPIADLIRRLNRLPHCFTLQSCYGHFVYKGQDDVHNLDPLPDSEIRSPIKYRIAYIAFCIEDSKLGKKLIETFNSITGLDPDNIQCGCAEWFWKRQINSYVLQVEPHRFRYHDTAMITFKEAVHLEWLRNTFFMRLDEVILAR